MDRIESSQVDLSLTKAFLNENILKDSNNREKSIQSYGEAIELYSNAVKEHRDALKEAAQIISRIGFEGKKVPASSITSMAKNECGKTEAQVEYFKNMLKYFIEMSDMFRERANHLKHLDKGSEGMG